MSANLLFENLEARIAPFNLLKHPFYEAWSAGELTETDLREYASEYWHAVSAFPTYLSEFHAQLPDAELRRTVLMNLLDEEGIGSRDGRAHSDIWMDFATGMGADANEVRAREINPETRTLIDTFRQMMREQPASALAALYAYESRVPEIARTKAEGLAKQYGADDATRRYFTLHEKADVFHARVWREALKAEVNGDAAAEESACDAAETAARMLWSSLDGVERNRQERKKQLA
jgi:pyrroloquinoline-quinone synthase